MIKIRCYACNELFIKETNVNQSKYIVYQHECKLHDQLYQERKIITIKVIQ